MNIITRFINELFNKKLKCERVGHSPKLSKIKIRKRSNEVSYFSVCEDFWLNKTECKRCGEKVAPDTQRYIEGYTSVSMPESMWDEIRQNGYCVL